MRAVRAGARLPGFAWRPWWTNAVLMGVQTGAAFGAKFAELKARASVPAAARPPPLRALQVDEPNLVPGFQEREPTTYNFNEMPAMDVNEFVASW